MKQIHNQNIKQKYIVLYDRVCKAIQTGRFSSYTAAKKQMLFNRLKRYEARLKKWGIAVASATALFLAPMTATGQITFAAQTGAANPFDGVDVGFRSTPTFVDIDNDGDFDAFSGESYGTIKYYQNTGTNGSPAFTEQTGAANPFDGVSVSFFSTPTFVDIDNDGDFDAFIGESNGVIKYYQNTGTNGSPAFTEQTGAANPFDGVDVGTWSVPTFVDIDNDGDFDAFSGEFDGVIKYYQNTGTNGSPAFTEQTGAANPFDGVDVVTWSVPTFVDIDNDGDFDAFIGDFYGTIKYYQNTGTNGSPAFTEQTGAANPFDGVSVGYGSAPIFVDIDNDGDFDAFIGEYYGTIKYYQNTSAVLPVEMLYFTAKATDNDNFLTWATATEENNAGFEVQKSTDGRTFEKIAFVEGNGTTLEQQTYEFLDKNISEGVTYYRLKQVDFDGQFEYSKIVNCQLSIVNSPLKVYPNPVQDKLTISEGVGNITIYNALGQPVIQITNDKVLTTINTTDLPTGIYYLQLEKTNGQIVTMQFVK